MEGRRLLRQQNNARYYLKKNSVPAIQVDFDITAVELESKLQQCASFDPLQDSDSAGTDTQSDHEDYGNPDPATPNATSPTTAFTVQCQEQCLPWENVDGIDDNVLPDPNQREATFFLDRNKSPAKAVLLFYLNSGLFRFEQHKDYDASYDGEPIDLVRLKKDITDEGMTEREYDAIIRRFYRLHPFTDFDICSCASCGIRQIERSESPTVEYVSLPLSHPHMQVLCYSIEQSNNLREYTNMPETTVTIPVNDQWDTCTINLAGLRSFHQHTTEAGEQKTWHLHPELVQHDSQEQPHVRLCPACHDSVAKGKIPPLSIANGIDFGFYKRLGLTLPNIHEQLMLARTRLYFAMVKVSSNAKGQVNQNINSKVRCHAVLFPHNSAEVASYMFNPDLTADGGLLNKEGLRKLLNLYMVDPQGRPDAIAREVIGTVNLIARPFVVAQWLIVMKWSNPHYRDIDVTGIKTTLLTMMKELHQSITDNAVAIENPESVGYEQALGSDVAHVRNTEVLNSNEAHLRALHIQQTSTDSMETQQDEFNDVSYSFITNSENAYHAGNPDDFRLRALEKLANLNTDTTLDEAGIGNLLFDHEDLARYLDQFPDDSQFTTARGEMPMNDFRKDDKGLGTAFPHVFMLGFAYKRSPGSLSPMQRFHLLSQFHQTPSSDRRVLGHLFDVMQRARVLRGVQAHVQSNRTALKVFKTLLSSESEKSLLRQAIQFPHNKSSKETLHKYLSHLQFSSKDVPYGALEGKTLKHKLLGKAYRYSPPVCFLTLSPGTIDNPRSVRLAISVNTNEEFPSVFEEGCPYGSNGTDFANNMAGLLSEATIQLPKAKRAQMANGNPVAFVQEYKHLISDVLAILLRLNIEEKGYYSRFDSESCRKTTYYKTRKGIFGHALAAGGVVENHEKGTLHEHFTIYAGLSPYVLQRFAHLQDICDDISDVLDTMYTSELPANILAGGLVERLLRKKKFSGEWNITDALLHSIAHQEVLPNRKDPTNSLTLPLSVTPAVGETDSGDGSIWSEAFSNCSAATQSDLLLPPTQPDPTTRPPIPTAADSVFGCSWASSTTQSDESTELEPVVVVG